MDILDDIGVSKLSAIVFFLNVNYSFKAAEDKTAVHVYMPINRTMSYRL